MGGGWIRRTAAFAAALWVAVPAATVRADDYVIDVYKPDKAYPGTTVFGDESDRDQTRIVEVDMAGKVVWSYDVPDYTGRGGRGMDVEWVPVHDSILFTREDGVYEVDRKGSITWSCSGPASHDADRLPNGNTLVVWTWGDDSSDPEVRELDPKCNVVWAWHAAQHVRRAWRILDQEGFTHANSAVRLANGNTLISLRNFYMLVEVNRAGDIVWKLPGLFTTPHDPEILANGNILVNTRTPEVLREITPAGKDVWDFRPDQRAVQTVRYNHKLPNGNVLFVERTKIIEITPRKEVVWQLRLPGLRTDGDYRARWLYKAERIPAGHRPVPVHAFAAPSETLKASGETPLTFEQQFALTLDRFVQSWLERFDHDHDGRISRAEYRANPDFDDIDTDRDGFLSPAEVRTFNAPRLMQSQPGHARRRGG